MELLKTMQTYLEKTGQFPGNDYWGEQFKKAYEADKENIPLDAHVSVKTADDKYLYWKSTVVRDDDLRYGDKPKKQYFETECFDNQQTMIEPSIKLKADSLEVGTVVEIYLPK